MVLSHSAPDLYYSRRLLFDIQANILGANPPLCLMYNFSCLFPLFLISVRNKSVLVGLSTVTHLAVYLLLMQTITVSSAEGCPFLLITTLVKYLEAAEFGFFSVINSFHVSLLHHYCIFRHHHHHYRDELGCVTCARSELILKF